MVFWNTPFFQHLLQEVFKIIWVKASVVDFILYYFSMKTDSSLAYIYWSEEANKNQFLYHIHEFHAYGWRNLPKYAVYFYSKHLTYLPGTYSCHANSRMHFPCITIPCLIEDKNQLQSANWILGISPNMTTLDKYIFILCVCVMGVVVGGGGGGIVGQGLGLVQVFFD